MKPCPHASSGCNYLEGECLDLCTPVQMADDLPDVPVLWPDIVEICVIDSTGVYYKRIDPNEKPKR